MSRKKKILITAISIAAILTIGIAGLVSADSPDDAVEAYCNGYGGFCTSEEIADVLGLTIEELYELRQDGLSWSEIAEIQNVSEEELYEAIAEYRQDSWSGCRGYGAGVYSRLADEEGFEGYRWGGRGCSGGYNSDYSEGSTGYGFRRGCS